MVWDLHFITAGREIGPPKFASSRLRIAKKQHWPKTYAVTRCPMMVQNYWQPRDRPITFTTRHRRVINRKSRFPPRDRLSNAFRLKNGTKSLTKCGDVTATFSTFRTCMVMTGWRYAS